MSGSPAEREPLEITRPESALSSQIGQPPKGILARYRASITGFEVNAPHIYTVNSFVEADLERSRWSQAAKTDKTRLKVKVTRDQDSGSITVSVLKIPTEDQTPAVSIVPADRITSIRPRVTLTDAERQSYKEAIRPFVERARVAYAPLSTSVKQLNLLKRQAEQLEVQKDQAGQSLIRHPLNAALTGIKMSRAAIESSDDYKESKERFRVPANELIAEVNKQKDGVAVARNLVDPRTTQLTTRPQIPFPQIRNKFLRPDSPTKPHNALGTIPNYRRRNISPQIEAAIRGVAARVNPNNPVLRDASLSITYLVPENIMPTRRQGVPDYLRDPRAFAEEVVGIYSLVESYAAGRLQPPTDAELGTRTVEQDDHIKTFLSALLAHHVQDELIQPNRTEKELQGFNQGFSNYIRNLANHITPAVGSEKDAFERVGKLIEALPGIQGIMVASKLSTKLYMDLFLPCIDQISEIRMSEVLRNISQAATYRREDRTTMTTAGYEFSAGHDYLFRELVSAIENRLEGRELDTYTLFEAIESLDYGDVVIKRLFNLADTDQREILLDALEQSGLFRKLARKIRLDDELPDSED